MKYPIFILLIFATTLKAFGASVHVQVDGIENSESATISIASYSYLETITVTSNGDYVFTGVPDGTHYVKSEANGYESLPSQMVNVSGGNVYPSTPIKIVLSRQDENSEAWTFKWEEDGSPAGYTQTTHVNEPSEIEFLGKKIVPSDVPSVAILDKDYHIYLEDEGGEPWSQEYAYRLVETLKTLPVSYSARPYALFHLTSQHLANDIEVSDLGEGYEVTISKDVFFYANPFLVNLDGIRGKLFSKRLHHAMTNFVTDFGNDTFAANTILEQRFGCQILNINYEELTKNITDETETHFQTFLPSEIVSIINMLEELPEGFHSTPHLKYLLRRINGMPHPLYPAAAAVAWPVENGYIEFTEKAFGSNNENFETLRLILHEKAHFLWAFVFSEEIKNDWIEVGGWYEEPNASDGWSTTKDVEFVSAYAHGHNPNEDMAESVAFYLKNPELLMSRAPEKYEFICNRIMHGTRYISKIPDHLTFEVLNLYPDYDYPGKIRSLTVVSSGASDVDKALTVNIELNDAEGYDDGASKAYVRLISPKFILEDGSYGSQFVDLYMYPIDESGHKLQGNVTISKYCKSGHWTASDIVVTDLQGYQRFEGRNDCVFDLYVNNSLEDTSAPKYEGHLSYTLTDSVIEGHNAKNLQVRFKASDNVGFKRIMCRLQFPGSTYSQDFDGEYSRETGEGIVNIPVTEYYRNGDYYINHISLDDVAGNNKWFTFSNDENDYPIQTIHIESSDPDEEHPEIDLQRITVYAEPTHPEAPDGETLVTISFYGRDDKSGLGKCNYRLRDPQGTDHFEYYYHRNYYSLYFDGDPTVWEHYLVKIILPQGSVPGIWGLAEMTVADKAFNEFTYNFVETLIFQPDDNTSDYELFADIEESSMIFGINALSGGAFSYNWRIIHEDSGLEINGTSETPSLASGLIKSSQQQMIANLSEMPKGDLVLIITVADNTGEVVSVKTQRLFYGGPAVKAENILLTPAEWQGNVGASFTIQAEVLPEETTDKTVIWSSSNESVATVDSEGHVIALNIGEAIITAQNGEVSATCKVSVVPVVAEILTLDPTEWSGTAGESFPITATVYPEETTNKTVMWSSSNESVATVDSEGHVIALNIGEAIITAQNGEVSATCKVSVVPVVAEILTLDPTEWSGTAGESFPITATVYPEETTNKTIKWSSTNNTVAEVTEVNGVGVVTVKNAGECVIIASTVDGSNLTAECQLLVGQSSIDAIFVNETDIVDIYTLQGRMLKKGCGKSEFSRLSAGYYVIVTPYFATTILIR